MLEIVRTRYVKNAAARDTIEPMDLLFAFLQVGLLLVLIVACCALFTNAIEWTGHRFKLSEGAVGSVLAAVGTALPETLVPIIAIVSGVLGLSKMDLQSGHDIGIGAILGAPFLLGTLAMFVSAIAMYVFASQGKRERRFKLDLHLFRRDLSYFFPAYLLVFLASFTTVFALKAALAVGLLTYYGVYVYRTLKKEHVPDEEFELPALMVAPWLKHPPTALILGQVVASLLLLLLMVHLFVEQINHIATAIGVNALLLSLIITPIATELPEKFNSVVWIRAKKDNLALGNITGAMVFQSCIPPSIGLLFTPWQLNPQGELSVGLCLASSLLIYMAAWKKPDFLPVTFLLSGVFYLAFLWVALQGV